MENNFKKNIVEANINKAITHYYNLTNNYLATCKQIEENLIEKSYSSIRSNYAALFMHDIMKKNISITEFNDVIDYMFKNQLPSDLENSFYRFFSGNCRDISLKEYLEFQTPSFSDDDREDAYSIWTELSYFFFDIKDESFTIRKEVLPYLISIVENISEENVGSLYGGGFINFCQSFVKNIDDMAPVFKAIQSNKSFEKIDGNNYHDFFSSYLRTITGNMWSVPIEEKEKVYCSWVKSIDNFEEIILNRLAYESKDYKIKLDFSLLNFINIIGEEKVFDRIDKVYKELLNRTIEEDKNKTLTFRAKLNIISAIDSSLSVGFDKKNYTIYYDKIDTNKTVFDNFIYVRLIDLSIHRGDNLNIPKNIRDYLIHEIETDLLQQNPELSYHLETDKLITYMKYMELENSVPKKSSENKKMKL